MRKIFLDGGSNLGQGFDKITKDLNIDEWECFLFEPNIKCVEYLKDKYQGDNIIIYHKALWAENCHRQLTLEYCPTNMDWNGGATNILENNFLKPEYIKPEYIKNGDVVECIVLSDFIKNNFDENDYIVLKLDIEGSEFVTLNKMLEQDTLKYINEIHVEWHERMIKNNTRINRMYYIRKFEELGIKYTEWY